MPVCAKCETGVGMDLFCPKCYYELEAMLNLTVLDLKIKVKRIEELEKKRKNQAEYMGDLEKRTSDIAQERDTQAQHIGEQEALIQEAAELLKDSYKIGKALGFDFNATTEQIIGEIDKLKTLPKVVEAARAVTNAPNASTSDHRLNALYDAITAYDALNATEGEK